MARGAGDAGGVIVPKKTPKHTQKKLLSYNNHLACFLERYNKNEKAAQSSSIKSSLHLRQHIQNKIQGNINSPAGRKRVQSRDLILLRRGRKMFAG